jgi:transposase
MPLRIAAACGLLWVARLSGMTTPSSFRVLDGAMSRASFDPDLERVLAPALRPGHVVFADNLSSYKSAIATDLLRAQGNDLIFLPPCSPDLNPVENNRAFTRTNGVHALIFSILKTLIRKVAAVCGLFLAQECMNYFKAAGNGLY